MSMLVPLLHRRRRSSGDARAFHGGGGCGGTPAGCNADSSHRSRIPTLLMRMIAGSARTPAFSIHLSGEISFLATPTQLQLHRNSRLFICLLTHDLPLSCVNLRS